MTLIFGAIVHPLISLMFSTKLSDYLINCCSISIFVYGWVGTMKLHHLPSITAFYYPLMIVSIFSVSAYSTFITFLTSGHKWKGRLVI